MKKLYLVGAISALLLLTGWNSHAQQSASGKGANSAKLQVATVDTVTFKSQSIQTETKYVIVLPEGYDPATETRYPVVYLLHGYGGNYASWIKMKPELAKIASDYKMIIVCPDGGVDSWYWDSPVDPTRKYETLISDELMNHIDIRYQTIANRSGRAITGLSMGGHGGLYLGFRHSNRYGACGSISGGVDIRPFPNNWSMKKWLGEYRENPQVWEDHTVINQLHCAVSPVNWKPDETAQYKPLSIIIDCGTSDFFYDVNIRLHEEMLYRKIDHTFITRPGAHRSPYWEEAIEYQLLFFHRYFDSEVAAAAAPKN